MFKTLSHELQKNLFLQKIRAIEKNDMIFLNNLHQQHPELFDKRFLYQMLQKELEITSQELPAQLDSLLQEIIKNYGKTH